VSGIKSGSHPGRVNAHTHLYSGLAPFGMPAPSPTPENFVQILERVWWRLDRALDEDLLRASAEYYVAAALLKGTTTLVDHHESPHFIAGSLGVIAEVCERLGVRAILCYGATERNFGADEALAGLAECERFIAANTSPRLRGMVGLHASFTVSDETIARTLSLCQRLGARLHIHLAEDLADVEDARQRGYANPLDRLERLGNVPVGSILAHGIHVGADVMHHAEEEGYFFVQNPRSNDGNGVGYPAHFRDAKNVALGTDGYPADMPEEERFLLAAAAGHGDSEAAAGKRCAAGRALSRSFFGTDVHDDRIVLRGDVVEDVIIGGKQVVQGGRLVYGDFADIEARAKSAAGELWKRMGAF